MAREFKETAHLKTDLEKLRRGYEHVFEKDKCACLECEELRQKKSRTLEDPANIGGQIAEWRISNGLNSALKLLLLKSKELEKGVDSAPIVLKSRSIGVSEWPET